MHRTLPYRTRAFCSLKLECCVTKKIRVSGLNVTCHLFFLDINECEPTNDCMQTCTNTEGGYNCSCDAKLFKTDPNDLRKCVGKYYPDA